MRHFLSPPFTQAPLPQGVLRAAAERLLVARSGPHHARPPRRRGTRAGAVALPVITAPAHLPLLAAARAMEQSVAASLEHA
jgi:hypothetical protein